VNIHLHIERLILDGLPLDAHQAGQVQQAVEAELTRLFATAGPAPGLQSGWAMPAMRAGGIELRGGEVPHQLGTRIAQSLHQGLQSGPNQYSQGGKP
jgi:hypothetical protein